jgi:integrase
LNGLSPFIWPVIEFAIETAMRRGEIMSIEWSRIRWQDRIVHLPDTKNGYSRDVPLSAPNLL